jgi:signal transduction histidine kinase
MPFHGPPHGRWRWHFAPRADLRRRIFFWLLGSLLMTALLVALVVNVVTRLGGGGWRTQTEGARAVLAHQLARSWDDPAARDAFARDVASGFSVAVTLEDAAHRPLAHFGAPAGREWLQGPVIRDGAVLGYFQLGGGAPAGHWPWAIGVIALVFFALWGAAGRVARRLARPFDELAQVAHALGEGRLDARVNLHCHAPGEIRVLARALNDMAERIGKQLADHRELLAGVSHELRTPLARIRILTELGRGSKGAKALEEIDREVVEMDGLVDQLLVSSRLDFQALSLQPLSPEALARRALERAGLEEALLGVEGEPGELQGDPTLLGRALANLIDNAQRHGGGLSALRVAAEGEGVRFTAEDQGPGFAEGDAERAFTAFFRGSEHGTLGLGLSLVRRIAEAHGGTTFAQNRPAGGASVGFGIPGPDPRSPCACRRVRMPWPKLEMFSAKTP